MPRTILWREVFVDLVLRQIFAKRFEKIFSRLIRVSEGFKEETPLIIDVIFAYDFVDRLLVYFEFT